MSVKRDETNQNLLFMTEFYLSPKIIVKKRI